MVFPVPLLNVKLQPESRRWLSGPIRTVLTLVVRVVVTHRFRRVKCPSDGTGEPFCPTVKSFDIRPHNLPSIALPHPSATRPFRLTRSETRRPVVYPLSVTLGVLQSSHLTFNSGHPSPQQPPRPQATKAFLPGLLPRWSYFCKRLFCAEPRFVRSHHMD
jgi:hypothetical protein